MKFNSGSHIAEDFLAAQEFLHSRNMTDGMPVVPPTPDLVKDCLNWAMLSSDQLRNHVRQFLKECPHWVNEMGKGYKYLYNFVDERNWETLKWLQFLGFEPKEKINDYGIGKMPFLLMMKEVNKIDVRSTTSPTSINSN